MGRRERSGRTTVDQQINRRLMPVLDLYGDTRANPHFTKFEIGDILFAEYTCPLEQKSVALWAHTDYLVHVVSGKKTWHTTGGSWTAESGQTLFFKKGAAIVEQFFDEDFCLLLFFIPDEFVRGIVRELPDDGRSRAPLAESRTPALRVENDQALSVFFASMMSYFRGSEKPSEHLLKLKLQELVVGVLVSRGNPALSSYFRSLAESAGPSIREVMEANFRYNLSLENYARLCHRSLPSFKRDFGRQFGEPPGRWLQKKRLDYAAVLLRNGSMSVSQVVLESGFEDLSHFSRVFKERFGISPSHFRAPGSPAGRSPGQRE